MGFPVSFPDQSVGSLTFPVVTPPPIHVTEAPRLETTWIAQAPRPEEVTARPGPDGCVMVSRGQRGGPGQAGAGVGRLPRSQRGSLPPGHHLCPGRARAPGWLSAAV